MFTYLYTYFHFQIAFIIFFIQSSLAAEKWPRRARTLTGSFPFSAHHHSAGHHDHHHGEHHALPHTSKNVFLVSFNFLGTPNDRFLKKIFLSFLSIKWLAISCRISWNFYRIGFWFDPRALSWASDPSDMAKVVK